MSRDQLLALTCDVDRLLAAGSSVAIGDEGLRRRAQSLRELAPKVPALAPVADAVERVIAADAKQAAPAVLDLLLLSQQLRFSLAPAGVDGPLEPVGPSGPWSTSIPAREVMQLQEALTEAGSGRVEVLKEAIKCRTITDLRLVEPLLKALDSGNAELAELVATEASPAFGTALLPELRRSFSPKGAQLDARRLLAISRIDPALGLELARAALAEGRPPLRIEAFKRLSELAPAEAEQTALKHLPNELQAPVRAAALQALKSSHSDTALELMVKALTSTVLELQWAAKEILPKLPHSNTTQQLIELLQETVSKLDEVRTGKKEKIKGKAKGKSPAAPEKEKSNLLERIADILMILGERGDRQAVAAIQSVLRDSETNLRENAGEALAKLGDPKGLEAALALMDDPKAWRAGIRAGWMLPAKKRFERLAPLCDTLSGPKKSQRERGLFLLSLFEDEVTGGMSDVDPEAQPSSAPQKARTDWDPRWVKTLLAHLDGPSRPEVAIALELVQGAKAVPQLLRVVLDSVKKNECGVVEAIGRLRVRKAVTTLVPLMPGQPAHHYCIHDALRRIGDKSAIPLLEKVLEKTKEPYRRNQVEDVIEYLHAHGE